MMAETGKGEGQHLSENLFPPVRLYSQNFQLHKYHQQLGPTAQPRALRVISYPNHKPVGILMGYSAQSRSLNFRVMLNSSVSPISPSNKHKDLPLFDISSQSICLPPAPPSPPPLPLFQSHHLISLLLSLILVHFLHRMTLLQCKYDHGIFQIKKFRISCSQDKYQSPSTVNAVLWLEWAPVHVPLIRPFPSLQFSGLSAFHTRCSSVCHAHTIVHFYKAQCKLWETFLPGVLVQSEPPVICVHSTVLSTVIPILIKSST